MSYRMSIKLLRLSTFQWKYDYLTATYLLLLNKKMRHRPIRLVSQKALHERQHRVSNSLVRLNKSNGITVLLSVTMNPAF